MVKYLTFQKAAKVYNNILIMVEKINSKNIIFNDKYFYNLILILTGFG